MGYNHLRIKENARTFVKNNMGNSILSQLIMYGVAIGAYLAVYIGVLVLCFAVALMFGIGIGFDTMGLAASMVGSTLLIALMAALYVAFGLSMYPLSIGFMGWYRSSIYRKTSLKEIFYPYKKDVLWSNIGTMFLMSLYIGLWSLLFVIPGIVKSYSYSQTVFIKAENPKIPAGRAIELSRKMMDGHKADVFYLHLSFIGWMLLSSITYNILGLIYVFPYFYAALAFAYEEIKADAFARGVVNPAEFEYDGDFVK